MGRKFLFACTGMIAASLSLAGCSTCCKDGCCLGGLCGDKPAHSAAGAGKGAGPVTTTAATPNAKGNPAAWNQNGKTATATAGAPAATPTQPTGWNGTPAAAAKPLTGLPESAGRAPYAPTTTSQPTGITPVSGTGYVPGSAAPIATSIEKPLPPATYTPPPHVHSTAAPAPTVPTVVPTTPVVPAAAPAPVMPSSALPTTSAAPVAPSTAGGQIYSVPASSAMPVVETSSAKPTTAPAPQDYSARPASAVSESKFSSAGSNDVVVMPSSGGPSISGPVVTPGQND